jgi:hypothetical protein
MSCPKGPRKEVYYRQPTFFDHYHHRELISTNSYRLKSESQPDRIELAIQRATPVALRATPVALAIPALRRRSGAHPCVAVSSAQVCSV